jgi:hypothetical protein
MHSQALLGSILCATLLSQPKPATTAPPSPVQVSAERRVAPPRLSIEPSGRVQVGSVGPQEKKTIAYTFTNTSNTPIRMRVTDL